VSLLILFRHAKSDWTADYSSDEDRPLTRRGIEASRRMGVWLAKAALVPDRAVSSTARRARDTLSLAAEAGEWRCPLKYDGSLYEASAISVIDLLRRETSSRTLLLVGHEPTWSSLASLLIGGGSIRLPTAAMAGIELEGPWSEVQPGEGRLLWLQIPRVLP